MDSISLTEDIKESISTSLTTSIEKEVYKEQIEISEDIILTTESRTKENNTLITITVTIEKDQIPHFVPHKMLGFPSKMEGLEKQGKKLENEILEVVYDTTGCLGYFTYSSEEPFTNVKYSLNIKVSGKNV